MAATMLQQQQEQQQQRRRRRQQQFLCITMLLAMAAPALVACANNNNGSNNNGSKNNNKNHNSNNSLILPHECDSIDVRNECESLWQLNGCTVIRGYLTIVLLSKKDTLNGSSNSCNYDLYSFPLLREITDFLIFFDVKGLRSTRKLFPNLTVIRGERLFFNYALGITKMPDLQLVEFPSLVAIQRGHVIIGNCPQLCQMQRTNWTRLTLSFGESLIFPPDQAECARSNSTADAIDSSKSSSNYCTNCTHCWSPAVCQYFENDNLIDLKAGSARRQCHAECLGGCYNATNQGCVVCKHLTDSDSGCVSHCPTGKFLSEHFQRCYTHDECVQLGYYTHGTDCLIDCPSGFMADETANTCVPCPASDKCIRICNPEHRAKLFSLFNLADADRLRNCHTLNSSVMITIRNRIDEKQLERSLRGLREIRGHLKIYRSPHLTSLSFLANLRLISGQPLESNVYSLIIYDNARLEELWQPAQLELQNGGFYAHRNERLCQRKLLAFRDAVQHNRTNDSLQQNEPAVLCTPVTLQLRARALSQRTLQLSWPRQLTCAQVRVLYKRLGDGDDADTVGSTAAQLAAHQQQNELEEDVCVRSSWEERVIFADELTTNGTDHHYTLERLAAYARYVLLVKTFGDCRNGAVDGARSEALLATTHKDIAAPPAIAVLRKTDTSLTLRLTPARPGRRVAHISHYVLRIYQLPEAAGLAQRNFCRNLPASYLVVNASGIHGEDYDDCCARRADEQVDAEFAAAMREDFACTLDQPENCGARDGGDISPLPPLRVLRLEANETTYTLQQLSRYRAYALQVQSCSAADDDSIDCGAYSALATRTSPNKSGEKVSDLRACWSRAVNEYRVHFGEPTQPNAMITDYQVHFRESRTHSESDPSVTNCVSRADHAAAHFLYVVAGSNVTYNRVAVRVYSLGNDVMSSWVNVTVCETTPITKLAGLGGGRQTHGLNVFLVCFLLGAGGTLLWLCYKRRLWRKLPALRRYLPLHCSWRTLLQQRSNAASAEDRQILVDGFEVVRFHNNDDDEYLE